MKETNRRQDKERRERKKTTWIHAHTQRVMNEPDLRVYLKELNNCRQIRHLN